MSGEAHSGDTARRVASASPYESSVGFCRALASGDRILVSGTAPIGSDGMTVAPGDPAAQTRRCLEVMGEALEALGSGLEDLVRTRVYLTRREDWGAVAQVHGDVLGDVRPACTFVVVGGLIDPEWRVELEGEARLAGASHRQEAVVGPFAGCWPRLGEDVYLAETAAVVGDVVLGARTSVWYSAVVRGDTNWIRVGDDVNVQDGAVVHTTRDEFPTTIGDLVTIGHLAMLHGCTVERGALIGIGARVLDGARIGAEAMVAAGALVPPGAEIPPRSLVLGAPARVRRTLSDEELAYNRETALNYRRLAAAHREAQREGRPSSA